jgi:hypothetical protein
VVGITTVAQPAFLSACPFKLENEKNYLHVRKSGVHLRGAIICEFACKSISSGVGEDRSKRPVDTVIR